MFNEVVNVSLFCASPAFDINALGKYCSVIKRALYRRILTQFAEGSVIKRGAFSGAGSELRLDHNLQLGENSGVERDTEIGDNVMKGLELPILSTHHSSGNVDISLVDQGYVPLAPVAIHDSVWIGARVIILPGVTVNEGAIIAASAIVTSDVPPFTIVADIPARVFRNRIAGLMT